MNTRKEVDARIEQLEKIINTQTVGCPEVGNVIDCWEQLPGDIRSDPGFALLNTALCKLYNATQEKRNEH